MMDVSIDLETLGTTPGSVILALGAQEFNPRTGDMGRSFYVNIDRESCEAAGLTTSADTLKWWDLQSPIAKAQLLNPTPLPLIAGLRHFSRFYSRNIGYIWGHGSTFDVSLLDAAYRAFHMTPPWKFHAARDTRTLLALAGVEVSRERGVHHYALTDAQRQAEAVCEAVWKLGRSQHSLLTKARMKVRERRAGSGYGWAR